MAMSEMFNPTVSDERADRCVGRRRWVVLLAGVSGLVLAGLVLSPPAWGAERVERRMQEVMRKFVADEKAVNGGVQLLGSGSWIDSKNFSAVTSDFDIRCVVPKGQSHQQAAAAWRESRTRLQQMIQQEFAEDGPQVVQQVLRKTNLYPPKQLVAGTENAVEVASRFQQYGTVPGLSFNGDVTPEVARNFSEGLWGEGGDAWTRHYESTRGVLFRGEARRVGGEVTYSAYASKTDLLHLGEGQARFTTSGMSSTTMQWLDHAAEELASGDPTRVAKYLDRSARDLQKARELSRLGGKNSQLQKDFADLIQDLGRKEVDLTALRGRIDDVMRRSRMEATILSKVDGSSPAEREAIEAILKDVRADGTLARKLRQAAEQVPVGKILEGFMYAFIIHSTMETAAERSIPEAMIKAVPELATLSSTLLVEVADACLESAKTNGAAFIANRQDATDLLLGIYTIPGRERGEFGRSYSWETIVGPKGIHNEEGLRSFVLNRCHEAASRDGVELEKGDRLVAEQLYERVYPVIRRTWLEKRHRLVREYIRLGNELRTARMVIETSPDPVVLPDDGSPLWVRLHIAFPDINAGEILARMKTIAKILAGFQASLYDGGRFSVNGKAGDSSYELYVLVTEPGDYSIAARFATSFHGGQLNWDSIVLTRSVSQVTELQLKVTGGKQKKTDKPKETEINITDTQSDPESDSTSADDDELTIVSGKGARHEKGRTGQGEDDESTDRCSLTVGQVIASVSGGWKEKIDAWDPPRVEPAVEVGCGGTVVAKMTVNPPAPNKWSLGNASTRIQVLFERKLGSEYGSPQTILNVAGKPGDSEYEQSGSWEGAGRLTVICGPAGGSGPLTSGQFDQNYSGRVVVTEVAASAPALAGTRIHTGDRITTDAGGELAVVGSGTRMKVGPNTEFQLKSDRRTGGRFLDLARGSVRIQDHGMPETSLGHRLTMTLTLKQQQADKENAELRQSTLRLIPVGTDYEVNHQGHASEISVYDGSVVIDDSSQLTTVNAGEKLTVTASGEQEWGLPQLPVASPPLVDGLVMPNLPGDPQWVEPFGEKTFDFADLNLNGGDWLWLDPKDDATVEVPESGLLQITVPDDNEFWDTRQDAPRLLHRVTGDFDIQARISLQCDGKDNAFWHWVAYSPGSFIGLHSKQFADNTVGAHFRILGTAWVLQHGLNKLPVLGRDDINSWPDAPEGSLLVRATRRQDLFKTYWSLDGRSWNLVSRHSVELPETIWFGAALQRRAYDGQRDSAAVFTVRDLSLKTAATGELPVPDWDFVQSDGFIAQRNQTLVMRISRRESGYLLAYSGRPYTGDIDAVARYRTDEFPTDPGATYSMDLFAENESATNYVYVNRHHDDRSTNRVSTDLKFDNGWYRGYQFKPSTDYSGSLRLVRTQGKWNGHATISDSWTQLNETFTVGFEDPVYLGLRIEKLGEATVERDFTAHFKVERAPWIETTEPPSVPQPPQPTITAPTPLKITELGLDVMPLETDAARALNIPGAARVTQVLDNSLAQRASIKVSDLIVAVNDNVVDSPQQLQALVRQQSSSSVVRLRLLRPAERISMTVELPMSGSASVAGATPAGTAPSGTPPAGTIPPALPPIDALPGPTASSMFGRHTQPPLIGIWAISAGTEQAHVLGIETPLGAVLTKVQPNSPAASAGLRTADVIVQFAEHEVGNYEDLECAMLSVPIHSRQHVTFVRGNQRLTTTLHIGAGPAVRSTYTDYTHPSGGYSLRLPSSWKIVRTNVSPQANINAHDLLVSRDDNFRFHCYVVTKRVADVDVALREFEQISQRDLGSAATVRRLNGLPVPMSMAAMPYQAQRRIMLYRCAFVRDGQFFLIDMFAPILSDPETMPDVLKTIFGTLNLDIR